MQRLHVNDGFAAGKLPLHQFAPLHGIDFITVAALLQRGDTQPQLLLARVWEDCETAALCSKRDMADRNGAVHTKADAVAVSEIDAGADAASLQEKVEAALP